MDNQAITCNCCCKFFDALRLHDTATAALYAGQALPKGWIDFPLASSKYDVPPRFVSGEAPIYPVRELLDGKSGVAVVRYTIGTDGRVHDAKVLFSSNRYFGTAVLYAMSGWIFKLAQKDGSPVPMIITQPMRFSAN
ncbi:MAG: energy transducer TonB [Metallibacterium sp.]